MSIDLHNESTVSLIQAARMLPPGRRGRPVTLSCVLRWVIHGVKGPAGKVRLEAIRMGGRWITCVEALERFATRQTPRFESELPAPQRFLTAGQRASQEAARELDRIGI